jgi:hypothetical protein
MEPLIARLMAQIGDRKDVEIISILDNKAMTIGRKRQLLHRIAQGKYCVIIDDDDDVTPDFVKEVCDAIEKNDGVDVIAYDQEAIINGVSFLISTDISHPGLPFEQLPPKPKDQNGNYIPCRRPPWHWCAWRTELANQCSFGDSFWGEDNLFAIEATKIAKTQHKINKVLHIYRWSASETAAPFIPNPSEQPAVIL